MAPLNFKYDAIKDEMIIEGVRYCGDLFRYLALCLPESIFRFARRVDGTIIIEQVLEGSAQIVESLDKPKNRVGR